jgi:dTDP-4-amino-4,6-dideoxygalactose transaminase
MNVPLVNLKAPLDATESAWRGHLEALLARAQFILGPELAAFEEEFAAAMGARYAVGVGTGTAAIELCLREAGVTTPDQEVIASPLTAPFTGVAIVGAGASIRFADIDPETLLLDPAQVSQRRTAQTTAVVPVHLYGQPCDLETLRATGLRLIQDACQAHGASFRGMEFSAVSPWVTYSFYPTKNLGALGDGGAVVTNDPAIAARLRVLRDGGRVEGHCSAMPGINSRLDDMQCCFLRAFLPHLAEWNAARARIAAMYDEAFRDCEPVRPVARREPSVNHLYVVRTPRRDAFREFLAARGVGTGIHYRTPLHLQPAFAGCGLRAGDLPHAEKACDEIASLPMWPHLSDSQVAYVIEQVLAYTR